MEKRITAKEDSLCNNVISGLPENETGSLCDKFLNVCKTLEPQFEPGDLSHCQRLGQH